MIENYQQHASEMRNRLIEIPGWDKIAGGRNPKWFGRFLSSIILATGGSRIVYLTGSSDFGDPTVSFSAEFLVFTETVVVHAEFDGAGDDAEAFTIVVLARSSLSSYGVEASAGVFDTPSGSSPDWPGELTVRVQFHSTAWALPLATSSRTSMKELESLVEQLRDDLISR